MNVFHITYPRGSEGSRVSFRHASPELRKGCGEGFLLSPFGIDARVFTIPFGREDFSDEELCAWCAGNDREARPIEGKSTERDVHLRLVADAVEFAKTTETATDCPAKVIAARMKAVGTGRSLPEIYRSLADAYPDACVFLFSTPVSGTWIGASPELLCRIERTDGIWKTDTVALAGTRPAGSPGVWDEKNIREQRMVTDFIVNRLHSLGMEVKEGETVTRRAGRIEHIMTPIHAVLPGSAEHRIETIAAPLLRRLSPTPALCGFPQDEAMDFIEAHESIPRDCYGGYFGVMKPGKADIYVNLRSGRMLTDGRGILLYAGGGITRDSIPEAEWEETERKLTTIMTHL